MDSAAGRRILIYGISSACAGALYVIVVLILLVFVGILAATVFAICGAASVAVLVLHFGDEVIQHSDRGE
jgi:hypothetical protein